MSSNYCHIFQEAVYDQTFIDVFDNHRIKSSVIQLFGLHRSMGPEVVWDSQVKKKKKKEMKKKSWRCCRRLGKQTPIQTVKKENADCLPGTEEAPGLRCSSW